MDSLLANYASSDDDDDHQEKHHQQQRRRNPNPETTPSSSSSLLFSSLPPPNSSLPSSLPHPKRHQQPPEAEDGEGRVRVSKPSSDSSSSSSSSLFFSALPLPKSQVQAQPVSNLSPLRQNPNPKRVVQFKPPSAAAPNPSDSDEEDEDGEKEKKRRRESDSAAAPSVKSFLSSVLPAPRYSSALGAVPLGSGSGRRSILEDKGLSLGENGTGSEPPLEAQGGFQQEVQPGFDATGGDGYVDYSSGYGSFGSYESGTGDTSNAGGVSGYGDYGHGGYAQYSGAWSDGSVAAVPATADHSGSNVLVVPGKRGRRDTPIEIVEVKQDDLTKDRPRIDQVKSTGIAFGPAYQPESSKGKPSKLHKRKHQIGTLYFDMKQKESELAERRSRGFLTKAQTQGKYGW